MLEKQYKVNGFVKEIWKRNDRGLQEGRACWNPNYKEKGAGSFYGQKKSWKQQDSLMTKQEQYKMDKKVISNDLKLFESERRSGF